MLLNKWNSLQVLLRNGGVNTLAAGKGFAQLLASAEGTDIKLKEIQALFTATTKASVAFRYDCRRHLRKHESFCTDDI